jgi:hypothetical protein
MKQPEWQQGISTGTGIRMVVATALLAWTGNACSQSVDTSMAHAMVDQPLSMAVQVRGFDWPASRMTPDCLEVQLQQGESGASIAPVRVRTTPSGDDGRVLVQISSPQTVTDTVLTGRLRLLCGADYTREFTVLVDPPDARRRSVAMAVADPRQRPATRVTPLPQPVAKSAPALSPRSTTRSDDPPPPVAASASAVPAAAPSRPLEEAEVQRLVNAVVSTLALPTPAERLSGEFAWQDLREEQRQTRAHLAALLARVEHSEREMWRNALLVVGAAMGLAVGLFGLRLVREGLMPRMEILGTSTFATSTTPTPATADFAPALAMPAPPSAPQASEEGDTSTVRWAPPATPPNTPPAAPQSAAITRWPDADFGRPNLDTPHASAELLQELEPHVAESPIGVAVVLERRLQELPGKCPWILLRLLALYRHMEQPWNHERVAAQLEALYNVRIPNMGSVTPPLAADLDAYPDTLAHIQQAWSQEEPAAAIAGLLLRPTRIEVLDQPAFEDALLLHGIARQPPSAWPAAAAVKATGSALSRIEAPAQAPVSRLMELLAA